MNRLIRLLSICAIALAASMNAMAVDLVWDGRNYLDIGLQIGADTTLVFPESVEMSAENSAAFQRADSMTDDRIMSIRPVMPQEQRVTFIGTKTKTVYLARFSTKAGYAPLYRITDKAVVQQAKAALSSKLTPTHLMRQMMAGQPSPAVERARQVQPLVGGPEFLIASTEVWETATMTGVIGTATLRPGVDSAAIRPSDINLRIPSLGQLRMMGADRWELEPEARSTTVYFVFTR